MEYITKQKFSLRNIPYISLYGTTIGLFEPDAEKSALYRRHLHSVSSIIVESPSIYQLPILVKSHRPDAVVVNPFDDPEISLDLIQLIAENFPVMPVIAVGDPGKDDYLDAIMKAGVRAHLHPRFTKPKDLLTTLEQILPWNKNYVQSQWTRIE